MEKCKGWDEVDAILAAIDPNRASWISLLGYDTSRPDGSGFLKLGDLLLSPEDWAALYGLDDILPVLLRHGYDSLNFINGAISESDCQELGISCTLSRSRLLRAVDDLPKLLQAVSYNDFTTVGDLLQFLHLDFHAENFTKLGCQLLEDIKTVTDYDLLHTCLISELGHRRRILEALNLLFPERLHADFNRIERQEEAADDVTDAVIHVDKDSQISSWSSHSTSASHSQKSAEKSEDYHSIKTSLKSQSGRSNSSVPFSELSREGQKLSETQNSESSPEIHRVFHRKSRSTTCASTHEGIAIKDKLPVAAETLNLRSPHKKCKSQKMKVDSDTSRKKKLKDFSPSVQPYWPHHPDVLLRDDFSYLVSYLGFKPLDDFTDQAEMLGVIQLFRCKGMDILKLPTIRLIFRYSCIKFFNPDNQTIISEHPITDIYCVSQDNTKRSNFAYVMKDRRSGVHYCHCFASNSPETASLIIQTLAQACQLADQLIEYNNHG